MTLAAPKVQVTLPPLHPGQQDIVLSQARFKVVVCGRRYGKTTLGIWLCVRGALKDPGIYWWVGPSYPVISASAAWPTLKRLVAPIDGIGTSESEHKIIFPNGSEIWIKSADNPEGLRGSKLRGLVLDEFAQIKEVAWTDSLRPTLTDYRGWALFIGTPKGKNWAYRLFESAKIRPGWESWQKPTTDNPFIDPREVEDARGDMSEESFAQEYLADFGASQFLVYPEIVPEIHKWRGPVPEFISYHGGMDFGGDTIGNHYSATAIAGRTQADELIIIAAFKQAGPNIAERQLNWTFEQEEKIARLRRVNRESPARPTIYRADKTQMVGIQFMRNYGLKVFPTKGGADSVLEGIEMVHRRLQLRTDETSGKKKPRLYWLPELHQVETDMMKYRWPEPVDDKEMRSNPLKIDDDLVDSIRYLVEGVDRQVVGDPQKLYSRNIPRLA